jgi:hypothetical protein
MARRIWSALQSQQSGRLGVIVNGSGWINRHTALVAVIAGAGSAARSTM